MHTIISIFRWAPTSFVDRVLSLYFCLAVSAYHSSVLGADTVIRCSGVIIVYKDTKFDLGWLNNSIYLSVYKILTCLFENCVCDGPKTGNGTNISYFDYKQPP